MDAGKLGGYKRPGYCRPWVVGGQDPWMQNGYRAMECQSRERLIDETQWVL